MTRRVLFVSHVLPPWFMGGTPRLLRWCRTLPALGWEVSLAGFTEDPLYTQQDELPAGISTIALPFTKKGSLLSKIAKRVVSGPDEFPDRYAPRVMELANAICAAKPKADLVVVSAPSFSLLREDFLGALKEGLGVPMVLDLRDAFSRNEALATKPEQLKAAESMQRAAVPYLSGAISVSSHHTKMLREWFPGIAKRAQVPNGFLREDYLAHRRSENWPGKAEGVLRIVFFGHAYGSRAPRLFLESIAPLLRARPEIAEVLRVRIVGRGEESAIGDWSEWPHILERREPIPYSQVPAAACNADVLLTVIGDDPELQGVPGAKVFEYLGARRPIFCLSAGAASRVIVRTETGVVANPKLPKQAQDALLHLYECWREDRTFVMGPESKSERYEAKSIVKDLVSFFEDVLGSSSASPQA